MHSLPDIAHRSNRQAQATWETRAVGSQRSSAPKGSVDYFDDLRRYRYGYETPFIPRVFEFDQLAGKKVLEVGVGNGIDAVEIARHGARYTGLDITENHLVLTRQNFAINIPDYEPQLIHGDLLESQVDDQFDVIYSFGVLHHIEHELPYLQRLRSLLKPKGRLMIAVYSKWSLFNAYMIGRWVINLRKWKSLDDWRSHFAEDSLPGEPVTIKIRSRGQVERVLKSAGFRAEKYVKCGFVQKYLPWIGKKVSPDGVVLKSFGQVFGWYHVFHCSVDSR